MKLHEVERESKKEAYPHLEASLRYQNGHEYLSTLTVRGNSYGHTKRLKVESY